MSVEDGRRPPRPEPWDMAREPRNNLERLIASAPPAPCTCPSGDGSLRWPCPAHPNADYSRLTLSPGARTLRTALVTEQAVAEPVALELPQYDDIAIDHFAGAMKLKMDTSRAKGRSGWDDPKKCTIEALQAMLLEHVAKGDPIDVANFCMMLWIRSGRTVSAATGGPA